MGQVSRAGGKKENQDSCAIRIPEGSLLLNKGICAVVSDGMSGAVAGREASEICVKTFISDYMSTPESWSVKNSAHKVLAAINRWLYGSGQRKHGSEKGLVATLSAIVFKSTTAYIFHIGDTRVYRLRDGQLEQLTTDHRTLQVGGRTYLSRAMGIGTRLEVDFRKVALEESDLFFLCSDGVYEFVTEEVLQKTLAQVDFESDLEEVATMLVQAALENGSNDNTTCQIVQVESLPGRDKEAFYEYLTELPFPPSLAAGAKIDGYRINRELYATSKTQLYSATENETRQQVVLKVPSLNYVDDANYIYRFLHEEWVGKRINSAHIVKVLEPIQQRRFLYYVMENLEGQTLRQWIDDNHHPALQEVRGIIEQIANGLYTFHRLEMVHRDIKPENIWIQNNGHIKIIDFGSTYAAGVDEISTPLCTTDSGVQVTGTINYISPELRSGKRGSSRSDIYSLGVLTYEMLTGEYPYGKTSIKANKVDPVYRSLRRHRPEMPYWLDLTLEKVVKQDPRARYKLLSEYIHALKHPDPEFVRREKPPLLERNPILFWKALAIILIFINIITVVLFVRNDSAP